MSEVVHADFKEEKLQVFQTSAQLCSIRTELERRRAEIQKTMNVTFDDDEAFLRRTQERYMPSYDLPVVVWILLLAGIATGICVLIYLLFPRIDQSLGAVLGVAGTIACIVVYHQRKKKEARALAELALSEYHKQKEYHLRKVKDLEKDKQAIEIEASRVKEALLALVPKGGIAESYWDVAHILWGFVETHRADSLKEALNLYDDYLFYTKTLNAVQRQNAKIASLERSIQQLNVQQQAAVASMTMMEISHTVDMCLLYNYIDNH